MSNSPTTPRHSRQSSGVDASYANYSPSSVISSDRRRQSSSFQEPLTPQRSPHDGDNSGLSSGFGRNTGMANLADELADAMFGSDDEGYEDGDTLQDHEKEEGGGGDGDGINDNAGKTTSRRTKNSSLSIPTQNGHGHRRKESTYDGSDFGSESDLESPGMPPSLVIRIDDVDSLARRGTESTGGPADGVFQRVTDGLRDLGSQSGVEGSATRLITAHSALASHLSHQTRQLHNLTYPLLSPLVAPPDPETIDSLLPLLTAVTLDMPRPAMSAYHSLATLHSVTTDLVHTLNYLSDTLHMSRQTTNTAMRKLRTAKELVSEMKREEDLREEGERWLTRGNWGERLQKRECAGVCRDVVGGFEEVCNSWRARLLAQAE